MRFVLALVAVIAAAAVAATATPQANAATSYPVNENFTVFGYNVNVTGTATLTNFQVSGNTISAAGTFVGTVTVTDPTTGATLQFPVNASLTAKAANIDADCATGTLTFDLTATLVLTQPFTATYTFTTPVTIRAGDNRQVRNVICQIETLVSSGASLSSVTNKLNAVLKKV